MSWLGLGGREVGDDRSPPDSGDRCGAGGTMPRAPFPCKPRAEVAEGLRRALLGAWADLRLGNCARAVSLLEAEVVATVCDIEAYTVDEWERVRRELEEQRPRPRRAG